MAHPPERVLASESSYLALERHRQFALEAVKHLPLDELKQLRAWLAEVLEGGKTAYIDYARLRGEIVHTEIVRREGGTMLRMFRGLNSVPATSSLVNMAAFPDCPCPAVLNPRGRPDCWSAKP